MSNALTPSEFWIALESGDTVLDLRPAAACARDAFPRAVSMPWHDTIGEEIAARWPGKSIVAYDQAGEWSSQCADMPQVLYLSGGLAAWQQWVDAQCSDGSHIVILGGKTGAGKTEWLRRLQAMGEQIVDLEALAQHKGSAFGNLDARPQLGNAAFQVALLQAWHKLDPDKRVWIEEEGPFLGQVAIPKGLYHRMLWAPMIELDVPFPERLRHIVAEYGDAPMAAFETAIQSLAPRMGIAENQGILHQYRAGKKREAIKRLLVYYDQAYAHRRAHYRSGATVSVDLGTLEQKTVAQALIAAATTLTP
jgi:tRNA 2-selenouridine synthase